MKLGWSMDKRSHDLDWKCHHERERMNDTTKSFESIYEKAQLCANQRIRKMLPKITVSQKGGTLLLELAIHIRWPASNDHRHDDNDITPTDNVNVSDLCASHGHKHWLFVVLWFVWGQVIRSHVTDTKHEHPFPVDLLHLACQKAQISDVVPPNLVTDLCMTQWSNLWETRISMPWLNPICPRMKRRNFGHWWINGGKLSGASGLEVSFVLMCVFWELNQFQIVDAHDWTPMEKRCMLNKGKRKREKKKKSDHLLEFCSVEVVFVEEHHWRLGEC